MITLQKRRRRKKRRAVPYTKAEDPAARIFRMIEAAERKLQAEFIRAITRVRNSFTLAEMEALLEQGRFEEAVALGTAAYEQFANSWIVIYVKAAEDTAALIEKELSVIAVFDQTNTSAVISMQSNRLRLVNGLTDSQKEAAREALLNGIQQGLKPREQARAFRDSIGLTAKQERFVNNFRVELNENSARVFARQLRDKRFDRTIQRAIDSGNVLDQATIDKMVQRYRERWIKHRAEVIARTEGLRSVHEGLDEMYRQAIEDGIIDADSLIRTWNTARDSRVRDFSTSATSHRSMHGQQRGILEPFTSGAGNSLMRPGDINAPGIDTIQCRCVVSTRFKEFAL